MKKGIIIVAFLLFFACVNVNANIICNDGTESETCVDCHQGCCSGHDGCLKERNDKDTNYLEYIGIGAGATGVVGAAAYAGYKKGLKK